MTGNGTVRAMLAALLCCAAPAGAVPAQAPSGSDRAASVDAAFSAYGRWLAELLRIAQPVQTAMSDIGNRAVAMTRAPDPFRAASELRPYVVRLVALSDATEVELARLDEPEFPILQLPPELRAGAIKNAMRHLNRSIGDAYRNYLPVLDAVARHDMAAARGGAARAMVSMQEIVASELLLVRAQQAALPPTSSAWQATNVQVLFLRTMKLYADAMTGGRDSLAALRRDLLTISEELDATAERGGAQADRELAQGRAMLSEAQRQGNVGAIAVLERSIRVSTAGSALFPLGRTLATLLRSQASRLPAAPSSVQLLSALAETYPIRDRLLAIIAAMGASAGSSQ